MLNGVDKATQTDIKELRKNKEAWQASEKTRREKFISDKT